MDNLEMTVMKGYERYRILRDFIGMLNFRSILRLTLVWPEVGFWLDLGVWLEVGVWAVFLICMLADS